MTLVTTDYVVYHCSVIQAGVHGFKNYSLGLGSIRSTATQSISM